MDDAHETSEAARSLAVRRWGDSKIVTAINMLAERRERLDSEQRRALRFLGAEPEGHDGD